MRVDGRPCLGRCSHTTISRLRLQVDSQTDRSNFQHRLGPARRRSGSVSTAPGVLSGARLRAPAGAILDARSRTNCKVTIPRAVIRRCSYVFECGSTSTKQGSLRLNFTRCNNVNLTMLNPGPLRAFTSLPLPLQCRRSGASDGTQPRLPSNP